jgi:RNA polymerase subunit RPABC4/transcription elongation factor Spt4
MLRELDSVIRIVLTVLGAYLAAFWLALVIWAFRDIHRRTRDVLVQVLATLLVLAFSLPGLVIYLILRPAETLSEAYYRSLNEESLLQEIETRTACPNCKRQVDADFLYCPACRTRVKRECSHCGRLLSPAWQSCPFCGTPAVGAPVASPARVASDGGSSEA